MSPWLAGLQSSGLILILHFHSEKQHKIKIEIKKLVSVYWYIGPCILFLNCFAALLGDMDWTKESISLQRNLALGDAKHRRLVQNLYEDVRQGK